MLEEVQKISWEDVILDKNTKTALTTTVEEFFDNKAKYKDYDVPWKVSMFRAGDSPLFEAVAKSLSSAELSFMDLRAMGKSPPKEVSG